MNLIIDEGNTRIKLAVFQKDSLIDLVVSTVKTFEIDLKKITKSYSIQGLILSSVTNEVDKIVADLSVENKIVLSNKTPMPFVNTYESPETLGVDRLALVAAAWTQYPNENSLVIDAGTCVTYDFINQEGAYQGGAISPGLEMRFKSMSVFTKKLPLINVPDIQINLLGKTTQQSMESGVLNGMVFEIDGAIQEYQQKFKNINIIITGGDANFLYKQLKNSIFVNPNFLLEGLNVILTYQNKDEAKLK